MDKKQAKNIDKDGIKYIDFILTNNILFSFRQF